MTAKTKKKKLVKWNRVKNIEQTYDLIDQGVIVKWIELKSLTHRLPLEQHEKLVVYS
jgi:hypothetical protein